MTGGRKFYLLLAATVGIGALCSIACAVTLASSSSLHLLPVALLPLVFSSASFAVIYMKVVKPAVCAMEDTANFARQCIAPLNKSTSPVGDPMNYLRGCIQYAAIQMKETRNRENSVIEHAVDVICVIDINCKILSVNPAASSNWGYTEQELIGQLLTDFLISDFVEETLGSIIGAENSIDKIYFENRLQKKSGEVVDLLWSAHWSASEAGLFCVAHDITERKHAEQQLRESEERVRRILEELPAGVAVVNKHGFIEFMNKAGCELTRYSPEEVPGILASSIFSFLKEPFSSAHFHDAANGTDAFDSFVVKKTGERIPAETSISKLQLSKEPTRAVIFLDMTTKYEMERTKREFVAMVSHELRTPLCSIDMILSFIEGGHGGELNTEGKKLSLRAIKESRRLMNLINDLLNLEKMEAGKFTMHFANTPVNEIVQRSVDTVERFARAQKVTIAIKGVADQSCYCDGARIIQILVNLIDNAIKFSPEESTVTLLVASTPDTLQVSVHNHGREIPSDKLIKIFEKFEQVDATNAVERKGTGLGLAICKTIVEQHGGTIHAKSSATEGTALEFTLPLHSAPENQEQAVADSAALQDLVIPSKP